MSLFQSLKILIFFINILLYDFGWVFILSHFVSCQEFDFASPLRSKMSYLNLTLSASLFSDNPQPNSLEIWRKLTTTSKTHMGYWFNVTMLQMKFDNKYGSDKDTQLHYCISIKYGSSNFFCGKKTFLNVAFIMYTSFFKNVKRVDF